MKEDYVSRINRVQDYIDSHLDMELRLEELARVAHFSPYHFHRIFRAMVGEPLNQFIQRLRAEKAASLLVQSPKKSITDVAFDCGFSSSATFARTFKEFFGMSATEWRAGGYRDRKIGKIDSKDRKTPGKIGQDFDLTSPYIDPETRNLKWRIEMRGEKTMKAEVEVKDLPEIHVAYVRHVGPYIGNAELFKNLFSKLMQWAGPRGLMRPPETMALTLYHDDLEITDEEKLRMSVCISVPKDTQVEGEIGKMTVAGGTYASGRFEIRPEQYGDAWNAIYQAWLPESGYQPDDGPPYELYLNNPEEHPEGKHIVEIRVPVRPQ